MAQMFTVTAKLIQKYSITPTAFLTPIRYDKTTRTYWDWWKIAYKHIAWYKNMKVFEIIPADFFSVLVSSNREIYADALMKLYEMFQTEINIRLKSFLAELEILLEWMCIPLRKPQLHGEWTAPSQLSEPRMRRYLTARLSMLIRRWNWRYQTFSRESKVCPK